MANALKSLRNNRGWSHAAAADAMGVSRGHYIKLERGERALTQHTIELAAKAFGVAASVVLGEKNSQPRNESSLRGVSRVASEPPSSGVFGARDLKVFAAVEAGSGAMVISTDPVELVPRPWYLFEVREGFAIIVVGESMVPAYEPGDMAIVNPKLAPMRDRDVVLASDESDGEFKGMVKRLVNWTATHWTLRQFNPARGEKALFTVSRQEWPKVYRVVGKYSRA